MSVERLKPGVAKPWLYLSAGTMWMAVGLMLIVKAYQWLVALLIVNRLWVGLTGIVLASGIYLFGFSKIARKNIRRIAAITGDHICLFAFQGWKSYPLVAVMISMGIFLRSYAPIPKPALAIIYLGIGGGLSLSSLHYIGGLMGANRHSEPA